MIFGDDPTASGIWTVIAALVGGSSAAGTWKFLQWAFNWYYGRVDQAQKRKEKKESIEQKRQDESHKAEKETLLGVISRLDAQNQSQQQAIDDCHNREIRLRGAVIYLLQVANELNREICRLGGQAIVLKDPSEVLDSLDALTFQHNTVKQGTISTHQEAVSVVASITGKTAPKEAKEEQKS